MPNDVVINGTTYPAVESVALTDANGNVTQYYPDAVRYVEQTLTDEQKAQARENIGALGADDVGDVLEQAKASGEFDGADGKDGDDGLRGTGIYLLKASPPAQNPDGYYEITPDMLDSSGVDIIGGDLLYNPSLYKLYEVVELEGSNFLSEYIGYLKGDAGTTPVKGTDYYTDADKTEMVGLVKAALPTITLTGTDKNDVVHTWTLYGVEA